MFTYVYACVRPQVFTATPRCTSPLANSPLSRKGAKGAGCVDPPPPILLESIPSRKGEGNNLRVVSFHQFPTFLTFLLLLFFILNGTQIGFHSPYYISLRAVETHRYASNCSLPHSIFNQVIYGGNMQSRRVGQKSRSPCFHRFHCIVG